MLCVRFPPRGGRSNGPARQAGSLIPRFALQAVTSIEAFGDSLTAGMLADTNVTSPDTLTQVNAVLGDFASYLFTGNWDKYLSPHEKKDLAWPTVLSGLLGAAGHTIQVLNHGVSKAKTTALASEVSGVKGGAGTAAFFFIGHNDLCASKLEPDAVGADYTQKFESALKVWDAQHEGATAYFVPVGKINEVFSVLDGYVWKHGTGGSEFSCDTSWDTFFPYCRRYRKLMSEKSLDSFLAPRIDAMNTALEKLADKWDHSSGRNRYYFVKDAQSGAYKPEYFAVDCFHLSATGQMHLAQSIFDDITR